LRSGRGFEPTHSTTRARRQVRSSCPSTTTRRLNERRGTTARERGDHYLRNTVLLATVLFLTALAQKFKVMRVRLSLIGVAACLLVVGLYFVFTYPVA